MLENKYVLDPWSIIENKFDSTKMIDSESIFSLGNGKIGQRGNFEEDFSNDKTIGNYISGIYYRDKTKVGWWKKGYPEYFAKMVNCPNWNKIRISINKEILDLNKCKVLSYKRELNMKEGIYTRSFEATLQNGTQIGVHVKRFLSLDLDELGAINYEVKALNQDAKIVFNPYVDAGITNEDSNWDDKFWDILEIKNKKNSGFIVSRTMKTNFSACTFMHNSFVVNGKISEVSIPSIFSFPFSLVHVFLV